MATPHIAAEKGAFAKTVLMPGDPLRAQFIAKNYLEKAELVNNVRGIQGYTGEYKGKRVSVMASGMGMPSIGIYSYELFRFYDVDSIIRVGSAGAIDEKLKVRDIVLALGACTDSRFAGQFRLPGTFAPIASYRLLHGDSSPYRQYIVERSVLRRFGFYIGMEKNGSAGGGNGERGSLYERGARRKRGADDFDDQRSFGDGRRNDRRRKRAHLYENDGIGARNFLKNVFGAYEKGT